MVLNVLRLDIERDFAEEEVGADARRRADSRCIVDTVDGLDGDLLRRALVERKVGGDIDEALVDRVDVNVLRRKHLQVDAVNLGRDLHVALHARLGLNVLDVLWDLEDAAAPGDAELLQRRRDGEADGRVAAVGIGDHQVRVEGVEPAVDALHGGVERFEVDAEVRPSRVHGVAPDDGLCAHGSSSALADGTMPGMVDRHDATTPEGRIRHPTPSQHLQHLF